MKRFDRLPLITSRKIALGFLLAGAFIPFPALPDGISHLDPLDPTTKQLFQFYYYDGDIPTETVVDEEAESTDESSDLPDVEPIVDPPIIENYLFEDPTLQYIIPEMNQPLSEEANNAVVPVFDEIGQAAKSEYVQGALLNQKGYTSSAMQHYLEAVAKDPENLWLKNRAAKVSLQLSDFSTATKLADEVLASDSENHTAMHTLATIAYYRDQMDEAQAMYHQILDIKPGNIRALEQLAKISYINERDYEKTKEYCAQIMEHTSRNLNAILWYAEASALTGEIDSAAELYGQLVHNRPSLISRLTEMANRLVRENKEAEAAELLRRGVEMRPESSLVVMQWERVVEQIGGLELLEAEYAKLLEANPLEIDVQETYANYLLGHEKLDELIEHRKNMLEINPRHISSLLSLARISLIKDDFETASSYFDLAISSGPEDPSVFRDIGLVYLDYGRTDKAKELLTEAANLDPEDAQTLVALAMLAQEEKEFDKSEKLLKLALDASPANEDILGMLAQFYRKQDRLYEASQIYEQLIAVNPSDVQHHVTLSVLYMEQDDEAGLDRVQSLSPNRLSDKLNFYIDYGVMARQYGYNDRAIWSLDKALGISPAILNIRALLAESLLYVDEADQAEKILLAGDGFLLAGEPDAKLEYQEALVSFYFRSQQPEKAENIARDLSEQDEDNLYYQTLVIDAILAQSSDDKEIKDLLNQIIRNFGADRPTEVKFIRAEVFAQQKQYDRAISILRPLLDDDSVENTDVMFDLAALYDSNGNFDESERLYKALITELEIKDSSNRVLASAFNNLAYLYTSRGLKLDEAEKLAMKANELRPRQDFILDTLGWIKFKRKDYKEAEKLLVKAYRFSLKDPEILGHLAALYEETDEPKKALNFYLKAAKSEPNNPVWAEKIDDLNRLIGQTNTSSTTP